MHPFWALPFCQCQWLTKLTIYYLFSCNSWAAYGEGQIELQDNNVRKQASGYGYLAERYIPNFPGVDWNILGRAVDDDRVLGHNAPGTLDIEAGETQFWRFPKSAVLDPKSPVPHGLPSAFGDCPIPAKQQREVHTELRRRQDKATVYITLNVCEQPALKDPTTHRTPDQLALYISTSQDNKKPNAEKYDHVVPVDGGYGNINFTASSDVYIGVSAPANDALSGNFNYELTASIDDFYAKYNDSAVSKFIDSDKHSALVHTINTTSCDSNNATFRDWMAAAPRFDIYIHHQESPSIWGLHKSMCGLKKGAQIQGLQNIERYMTTIGGGQPKQQFHIGSLNSSSAYYAILGLDGADGNSSTVGGGKVNGGGTIYRYINFTTQSSPNCALVYNLSFCTEVAYAVPSNKTTLDDPQELGSLYDNYASSMNRNFQKSLAQIPCNTTASAQYSLAVNCTDCEKAYKNWLCAVTIPRCQDFSNPALHLQPRAVNQAFLNEPFGSQFANNPSFSPKNLSFLYVNSSRNKWIDENIKPGTYKELLPCQDLCYGLVRSCPAALGFSCPLKNHGLEYSYAERKETSPGQFTCNSPGLDLTSAATHQGVVSAPLLMICLLALLLIAS